MHDDLGVMCKNVCLHLPQADPLYMGVSAGDVCSLLWLLFLQRHVGSSTDTPLLLGCSHITNVLQVYLQQGVFTSLSMCVCTFAELGNLL